MQKAHFGCAFFIHKKMIEIASSALSGAVEFGEKIGWLSNILGLSCLLGVGVYLCKKIKPLLTSPGNLSTLLKGAKTRPWRIVILDDQPKYFPTDFLIKSGFDVTSIQKISITEYKKLLSYDIALIDISGVVSEDMEHGGGRVIQSLSKETERPLIISISNNKFGVQFGSYTKYSDEQWDKNFNNEAEWRDRINEAIERGFEKTKLLGTIEEHLLLHGRIYKKNILSLIADYFNDSKGIDAIKEALRKKTSRDDAEKICGLLHKLKVAYQ